MATFASFSTPLVNRVRRISPAWRWAIGAFVAARLFYTLWSLVILLLVPLVVQNLDLFGTPVVAIFDVQTSEPAVFSRVVNGQTLTFQKLDAEHVTDTQTGSAWTWRDGRATSGTLAGKTLAKSVYTSEDVFPYHGVEPEPNPFWGIWQRFDVLAYQAIAEHGYSTTLGDVHFPPLYPVLERIGGLLLGGNVFLAGWLISQIALVVSLGLVYQLTEQWRDAASAQHTLVILVLFPTAFFFFTAYSESLFLLLVLLCFMALQRERWVLAGLCAFFAILTRLQGVALLVPLAYCAWQSIRAQTPWKKIPYGQVVMLALPLLAGAFYLLLRGLVGDGNILPTNEPQLNARLVFPWENLIYAVQTIVSGKFLVADVLNLLVTLLALFILIRGWRAVPVSYSLFVAATLLVVAARWVDTQPLNSMVRYVLALFPLFMLLGAWSKNEWVNRAMLYPSVLLGLYLSAQFFLWGWVA